MRSSPSPPRDRYYPSPYGPGPNGSSPVAPAAPGAPGSEPGGRIDDGRINGRGNSVPPFPDRPYDSTSSLPLRQKPLQFPPGPQQPPQALPPQQQPSYLPQMPPQGTPSMVQVPPEPTTSTAGSAVGSSYGGGAAGGPGGSGSGSGVGFYEYPAGYGGFPPPPSGPPALTQSPGPMQVGGNNTLTKKDLRAARTATEAGLEQLLALQQQRRQHLQYGAGAANVPNSTAATVQEQLRLQTGAVLRDLRTVRRAVAALAKTAENHRFRRWLVGGFLATFVPLVRRLFRRPNHTGGHPNRAQGTAAANDTEYAFARSRTLVDRMLGSLHRRGGLASLAFFVFAVLYVFTNEVSLRVARTVGRRLKRLSSKIERGDEELDGADLKALAGWRWRVLLWGKQ
ncbi:hypothetical protein SPI_00119 [Niveomyces insectorum RCEF 264]|uniref:Uncharacterized protein n=1 Tax=Niveomyces insectorum RCEF 264 TaxID=1081102 RepID=A0A167ZUK4_9HYPO|nr:hypothetical protein SPI_00119 [Niveomyces insectorum RCEF 264]